MRKYFYEIVHAKSRQDGKPLTRIYVWAKRAFSHREMFSKQEQLLDRLTDLDCPLDGAMQIAFQKEMSVSSLCFARIDLNRMKKEIDLDFIHSLEIVAFNPLDAEAFIKWLSSIWKGEWEELESAKT